MTRTSRSTVAAALQVALILSLLALLLAPGALQGSDSLAYSTAHLPRDTALNTVPNDGNGILRLNGSPNATVGQTNQHLLTTENPLTLSQNVTVSLSSDIANWHLTATGTDSRSVLLSGGANESFYVDIGSNASTGPAQYYVRSNDGTFWFNQTRRITIEEDTSGSSATEYVYAVFGSEGVTKYYANNGTPIWTTNLSFSADVVAVNDSHTVYAAGANGKLAKLDNETGAVDWAQDVDTGNDIDAMDTHNGSVFVGGDNWTVTKVDGADGSKYWANDLGWDVMELSVNDTGTVYASNAGGGVFRIAPNGSTVWYAYRHDGDVESMDIGLNGYVYAGDTNENLHKIAPNKTLLWNTSFGSTSTAWELVVRNDTIYGGWDNGSITKHSLSGDYLGRLNYTTSASYDIAVNATGESIYNTGPSTDLDKVEEVDGTLLWSATNHSETGWDIALSNQSTTATNTAPTASFTYSPDNPDPGETITFDGSQSWDDDGSITAYEWDFDGDGTVDATGESVTHSYNTTGDYNVTLTVTDDANATDAATKTVSVTGNNPPTVSATANKTTVNLSETVGFNGTASDPDGDNISYAWDFEDDGTTDATTEDATHAYNHTGNYTVNFTATDEHGASNSTTLTITVQEQSRDEVETIGEVGSVTFSTGGDSDYYTFSYRNSYESPVLVLNPISYNGSTAADIRIRDVNQSDATVQIEEWDHSDESHTTETVSYVVMEKGVHTLKGGTPVEAGEVPTENQEWMYIYLDGAYDTGETPIVFAQSQSKNGGNGVTTRQKDVRQTWFQTKLQEQESKDTSNHATESLGYIAIGRNQSSGPWATGEFDKQANGTWRTMQWANSRSTSDLNFLLETQETQGANTGFLRYKNPTATALDVMFQEETSSDTETGHSYERTAYWVFEGTQNTTAATPVDSGAVEPRPIDTLDYCSFIVDSSPTASYIENVTITDANGATLLDTTDASADADGYQDRTDTIINASPGEELTLTVGVNASGNTYALQIASDLNSPGSLNRHGKLAKKSTPYQITTTWTVPTDARNGNYPLRLFTNRGDYTWVCDSKDYGEAEAYTLHVNATSPSNYAPTFDATADPRLAYTGEDVSFSATGHDPDGSDVSYEWDFTGDGDIEATGASPMHTYQTPGTYEVLVTAKDGEGGVVSDSILVHVSPDRRGTDFVYTGAASDTVSKYYKSNGTISWNATVDVNAKSIAVTDRGDVYAGTNSDGELYRFAADGWQAWGKNIAPATLTDIAVDADGWVYVSAKDGTVQKVAPNGSTRWTTTIDSGGAAYSIALGPNGAVYSGTQSGTVAKLSSTNGSIIWTYSKPTAAVKTITASQSGYLYLGTTAPRLQKVTADTGTNVWNHTGHNTAVRAVGVAPNGTVYSGDKDGHIIRVNQSDATTVWNYSIHTDDVRGLRVGPNGDVFSVSNDNTAKRIQPNGSIVWTNAQHTNSLLGVDVDGRIWTANEPPTAAFDSTPSNPTTGTTITFNASNSSDPDGNITTYEWDFTNDGTVDATGKVVSHTYSAAGDYTAALTVTDNNESTDTTTQTITVTRVDYAYTGSKNGYVHKVSKQGTQVWNYSLGSVEVHDVEEGPNGYVYLALSNGTVQKVGADKSIVWSYTNQSGIVYDVAVDANGYVYSGGEYSAVHKTYPNGTQAWNYSTPDSIIKSVVVDTNGYVYSGDDSGDIHRVTPSGTQDWLTNIGSSNSVVDLTVDADWGLYTAGYMDQKIRRLNVSDGSHIQDYSLDAYVESVLVDTNGAVYGGAFDTGYVRKFTSTGSVLWNRSTNSSTPDRLAITGSGAVYAGLTNSNLYRITETGALDWNYTAHDSQVNSVGAYYNESQHVTQSPSADFYYDPKYPETNQTVTFNATKSADPDGNITDYNWDFNRDGTTDATGEVVTYNFTQAGDYAVTLTVADDKGRAADRTRTIDVAEATIPAGEYVYTASQDGTVLKRYADSGATVWNFTGHNAGVNEIAVGNNRYVYTASADNSVRKIAPNGTQVWNYSGHSNTVNEVVVDGNGYVYSASDDNTVHKIAPNGTRVWSYTGHSGPVLGVAVDTGGYVYTASKDWSAHKVSPSGGQVWSWSGTGNSKNSRVTDVAVDAGGNVTVAKAGQNTGVEQLDSGGMSTWSVDPGTNVYTVYVDGAKHVYAGTAGNTIYKYDTHGSQLWSHSTNTTVASVGVDTNGYVFAGVSGGETHKLHASNGSLIWTAYSHSDTVAGTAVEYPTPADVWSGSRDYYAKRVYGNGTGANWSHSFGTKVRDVAVGPDGYSYAALDTGTVYKVAPDGSLVWNYTGHSTTVWGVEVDPDGYVYTAAADDTLHKLAPNGSQLWTYTNFTSDVNDIAIGPQWNIYATSASTNVHKITRDGDTVWNFTGHSSNVPSVEVDDEGYVYTASGDDTVKKIAPNGTEVWTYTGHSKGVYAVAVDTDGYVYSGSYDQTVHKITPDGTNVWTYAGHGALVRGLVVGPNGYVYTGAYDNEVHKLTPGGMRLWAFTGHADYIYDVDTKPR